LPADSISVSSFKISSGQVELNGDRMILPSSSEKELTKTKRSGACTSRYTKMPHMMGPSGERME